MLNQVRPCNCINSQDSVLDDKYFTLEVVYGAQFYTKYDKSDTKFYIGTSKPKFKDGLAYLIFSFKQKKDTTDTSLSILF